jgi:hypothetical protein
MKRRLNMPKLSDRQDFVMRHVLERARKNQDTYISRLAHKIEWNDFRVRAAVNALEVKGYVCVSKVPGGTLVWPLKDERGVSLVGL